MRAGLAPLSLTLNMNRFGTAAAKASAILVSALTLSGGPSLRADDAPARQIWVVTDSHHPVLAPANVRLIELDAPALLEAELSASLPNNPNQAAVVMRQRLASRPDVLRGRMAVAYQGVIDAWTLGVSKVPAVVVDHTYVIYGERDVYRAISKIEMHRSNHP